MNGGKYIFSQIMALMSHKQFKFIEDRHFGDYKVRRLTCWKQFLCMIFRQLTSCQSFTDRLVLESELG